MMLKARDDVPPSFRFAMCAEIAMAYDFLQAAQRNGGQYGYDEKQGLLSLKGSLRADCDKARDAIKAYFEALISESEKPYGKEVVESMDAAVEKAAAAEPLVKAMAASFSRAYELSARCEAMRRGTRLAYEIAVYRDKNKKWPASLKDLPTESDRKMRIDPFSNSAFVYKLSDDSRCSTAWASMGMTMVATSTTKNSAKTKGRRISFSCQCRSELLAVALKWSDTAGLVMKVQRTIT